MISSKIGHEAFFDVEKMGCQKTTSSLANCCGMAERMNFGFDGTVATLFWAIYGV